MKRVLNAFVILTVALSVVMLAPAPRAEAMSYEVLPVVSMDCMEVTISSEGSFFGDRDNTGSQQEVMYLQVRDGNGTVLYQEGPHYDTMIWYAGVYNLLDIGADEPEANPVQIIAYSPAGNELPEQIIVVAEGECEGLEEGEGADTTAPVPGCDTKLNITKNAVVGALTAPAALYWKPGELVQPNTVLDAGNTAWVLGVDSTGEYTHIIWGCDYVWVLSSTIGPNYDEVWNGAPLPTDVVD